MEATTTILMTNKCPLNCRYCNLAETMQDSINKGIKDPTFEELDEMITNFIKENLQAESRTVTLTGGEPFVRWDIIKKLIEKHGKNCRFDFNTSGYLLTPEIIEWLSDYQITWNLSVDGGESVTNYLRPLRNPTKGAKTYWQKLKEIVPTLLYTFPSVYCKIIIPKRLIKNFYESYLELEQIGFKKMYVILDLTERDTPNQEGTWTQQDYDDLLEQFKLVAEQRYIGMKYGIERMEIIQMEEIIKSLLNQKEVTPFDLVCKILDGRSVSSMFAESIQEVAACYSSLGYTRDEFEKLLVKEYEKCDGKCPNNSNCPFFKHCSIRTCVKDNIEIRGNPYVPELAFCKITECLGNAALYFLNLCNTYCGDSEQYKFYLGGIVDAGETSK